VQRELDANEALAICAGGKLELGAEDVIINIITHLPSRRMRFKEVLLT
jgi:hypothetical protein